MDGPVINMTQQRPGLTILTVSEAVKHVERIKGTPGHIQRCHSISRQLERDLEKLTISRNGNTRCPLCDRDMKGYTKGEVLDHIYSTVHWNYSRFRCSHCSRDFTSLKNLHRHICHVRQLEGAQALMKMQAGSL